LSPYQLHRRFRARVGEAPTRYVRRLRLERAAAWLKLSPCAVTDAAFGAGYTTHEAFTRAFHAHFGLSPRRFRARLARCEPPADATFRVVRLPARRIAYVRHVGPYDDTRAAFARVAAWGHARGLLGDHMLAVYLDDQDITPPERTRCDVALFVGDDVAAHAAVGVRTLPGGDFAVFHHAGEVGERRRLYAALFRGWLPSIRRQPSQRHPHEVHTLSARVIEQTAARIYVPLRAQ